MATRTPFHRPSLDILVQFVFTANDPHITTTNLATGHTTRIDGDVWSLPQSMRWHPSSAIHVYACAINPPPGTSIELAGVEDRDPDPPSASGHFALVTPPGSPGVRFSLAAGDLGVYVQAGEPDASHHWVGPILTAKGGGGFTPKVPRPRPPREDLLDLLREHGQVTFERVLGQAGVLERVAYILADRDAAPEALAGLFAEHL